MATYILWVWGLKGPEAQRLDTRDPREPLSEWERANKLGPQTLLKPEDEGLDLVTLRRLYPAPADAGQP